MGRKAIVWILRETDERDCIVENLDMAKKKKKRNVKKETR